MILIKTTLKKRVRHQFIKKELRRLLSLLKIPHAELSILIVGDSKMRSLNRRFRGIDRTTDVLSFPQIDRRPVSYKAVPLLLGDIVINPHQIKRQAIENNVPFKRELRHVLIHGLLHLLGYDHERSDPERVKMERREEKLLYALERMDHKR
jgi:probable rRNA maturation factor